MSLCVYLTYALVYIYNLYSAKKYVYNNAVKTFFKLKHVAILIDHN